MSYLKAQITHLVHNYNSFQTHSNIASQSHAPDSQGQPTALKTIPQLPAPELYTRVILYSPVKPHVAARRKHYPQLPTRCHFIADQSQAHAHPTFQSSSDSSPGPALFHRMTSQSMHRAPAMFIPRLSTSQGTSHKPRPTLHCRAYSSPAPWPILHFPSPTDSHTIAFQP